MATTVIQWMLDTRPLWPGASQTTDLSHIASRAMSLLSPAEQSSVLKYYFLKDAKLSLASSLLKRLAIARFCGVGWPLATSSPDPRSKKPIFILSNKEGEEGEVKQPLLFNVSHQAGVVVLFAVHNPPKGWDVGVDIVCPPERRDRDRDILSNQGWAHYVAIHEEVFSPRETQRLLFLSATGTTDSVLLEHFYALWCLREAYVKMTGEALLAPWLADLEMRNFAPPPSPQSGGGESALEILFRGRLVEDVDVRLQSVLAGEYMVCTALRRGSPGGQAQAQVEAGPFELLDMEDVLAQAEALNARDAQG